MKYEPSDTAGFCYDSFPDCILENKRFSRGLYNLKMSKNLILQRFIVDILAFEYHFSDEILNGARHMVLLVLYKLPFINTD